MKYVVMRSYILSTLSITVYKVLPENYWFLEEDGPPIFISQNELEAIRYAKELNIISRIVNS